jgi:membrane-associated protease RseP (regulator of RpoE activity)
VDTTNRPPTEQAPDTPDSASRLELVGQLRAQLTGVLVDAETQWNTPSPLRAVARRRPTTRAAISFRGHLAMDESEGYALLRDRFAALGYTPLLYRQGEYEIVTAIPVVFGEARPKRWWINLVLFLLTIASTTLMGALLEQNDISPEVLLRMLREPQLILAGLPASLTIMGILGVHELAHYFAARVHGLDSSLPYFIPFPFGLIGTMGAIIRMRKPFEDRNSLFDVGAAGPLAGILVALPLFFVGLMTSPALPPQPGSMPLGTPLLIRWMEDLVYVLRDIPQEYDIYVNSWTFTAWFALFVSGLNLLPIGQLDGGHVAYAVLGDKTRILSIVVLAIISILGILLWPGWYTWMFFIFLSGWLHPPPLNGLAPLSRGRKIVGIFVFALMVLLFTPSPFPSMWSQL